MSCVIYFYFLIGMSVAMSLTSPVFNEKRKNSIRRNDTRSLEICMRADFFRLGHLSVAPLASYFQLFRPFLIAVGLPGNINSILAWATNMFARTVPGYSKSFTMATQNSPDVNAYLNNAVTSLKDKLNSNSDQFMNGLNSGKKNLDEFLNTLPGNNKSSTILNQLNPNNLLKDNLNSKDNQFTNGFQFGEKMVDELLNKSPTKGVAKSSTRPKKKIKKVKPTKSPQDDFTGLLNPKNNPLANIVGAVQDSVGGVSKTLSGRAYNVPNQQKKSLDVCLTIGEYRNRILKFLKDIVGDSIAQFKGGAASNILTSLGIDPVLFTQFLNPSMPGNRNFQTNFFNSTGGNLLGNLITSPFNILNSLTNGAVEFWLEGWNSRRNKDILLLSWNVKLNEDEMVGPLADWTGGVFGLTFNGQSDFGLNLLKLVFGLT